jgi:VanZ family protein
LLTLYLVGTVVLFLAPVGEPPGLAKQIPVDPDKAAHFGIMALLAVLIWWNLAGAKWRGTIAVLVACGYAVVIELLQSVLPHRSGDVYDLLAGALGAVVGVAVVGSGAKVARAVERLWGGA